MLYYSNVFYSMPSILMMINYYMLFVAVFELTKDSKVTLIRYFDSKKSNSFITLVILLSREEQIIDDSFWH